MDVSFMAFSRLAFGHWEGQPLYALADLGIHSAWLQPRSCADLAAELGCPAEALERLLDCAVAQKLLVCEAGRYGNSELSARFLTEDSPESLLSWIRIMDRWKRPWAQLAEAVRQERRSTIRPSGWARIRSSCATSSWACTTCRAFRTAIRRGAEGPARAPADRRGRRRGHLLDRAVRRASRRGRRSWTWRRWWTSRARQRAPPAWLIASRRG